MPRLLIIPARDRAAADKLTLTLHGPQTPDRARMVKVLGHLLASDGEWDEPRPNVDFIGSMDEPGEKTQATKNEAASMAVAMEWGYRACEKGMNLQAAQIEFAKVMAG